MKKVILTGGTGFIGRWLIKELIENDVEVIAFVRKLVEDPIIEGTSVEYFNVFSSDKVSQIVYDSEEMISLDAEAVKDVDAFYHLAWGGVSSELKNDWEIQLHNIDLSVKMLDWAHSVNIPKFIAMGTVAEYSFCEGTMDVDAKQTPNDMYGATKTATHYLLETRARLIGMPFIWCVIPSTYGEGRRDNNIITYTIKTLLKGDKPSYGYLTQMWDFLYVAEVARALRFIGDKGLTKKTYAIGSGVYKPLREYIEIIRDSIDPKLELGIGDIPSYSDKVFSSCVSISELTKDTGFEPQVSFEEGIKRTIPYFKTLAE